MAETVSFNFGKKDKATKLHQDLQIKITGGEAKAFSWFLEVFFFSKLGLQVVSFIVDHKFEWQEVIALVVGSLVSAYGVYVGYLVLRGIKHMRKKELFQDSNHVRNLTLAYLVYCLVEFSFRIENYKLAWNMGLFGVLCVLSAVFCSIGFVGFYFKNQLDALAENISQGLSRQTDALYRAPMSMLDK